MNNLLLVFACILLCVGLIQLLTTVKRLTIAVLLPALIWLGLATFGWSVAVVTSFSLMQIPAAVLDQLWYWAAVLSCCPLIAVLGAKRPTSRVWTWFIVIPLIVVLGWPALATLLADLEKLAPIKLQLPALIGFALILIMGGGNYSGSRYGASVFLGCIAVALALWPVMNRFRGDADMACQIRGFSAIIFALAILHGFRQSKRPVLDESNFDMLWFDFRDAFGIVWSIRIQDRINQTAEKENWCVRLGTEGFTWKSEADEAAIQTTQERLIHTLHWLLRRFVDPEWLDTRLNRSATTTESTEQCKSP